MTFARSRTQSVLVVGLILAGMPAATRLLAREPLVVRVSPTMAQPPAFVTVRTDVESHEDNRSLEVSAEGDDFFTSSRLPLEGRDAPRFNEFHFDNLPEGRYTVRVVLMGSTGPRATVSRAVNVGSVPDGMP
jgi:hypothetical protein